MTSQTTKQIFHTVTGNIIAKKSKLPEIVEKYFVDRKGDGARKLAPTFHNVYAGIPRKRIQAKINPMKEPQNYGRFLRTKLHFVWLKLKESWTASGLPVSCDGKSYKYIMSVICLWLLNSDIVQSAQLKFNKKFNNKFNQISASIS